MSLPAEVEELIASLKRQIAALQAEVADAASRRSRSCGSARGERLLPLRFAARTEVGDRGREAPSVRPSRAPARGYGTSGFDLPLCALPRRDEGGVSRGGGVAPSIWRAHQGCGDLTQYPA